MRRLLHRPAAVEVEVAVEDTAVEDTALLWVVEVWVAVTALVEAFMAGWAEASVAR